jgi:hypothetical protein
MGAGGEQRRASPRLAATQEAFRGANEAIAAKAKEADVGDSTLPFICECARRECRALTLVTLHEYEDVRSDSRRFLVQPGHDTVTAGRVVLANDRYIVVAHET